MMMENMKEVVKSHCVKSEESKYGIFSGPYFPVFRLNTGKYGPEKTPYMETFHAMSYTLWAWNKKEKQQAPCGFR